MTLDSISSVLGESTNVTVEQNGKCIASYDGRNSIDPEYNTYEVKQIIPEGHSAIRIIIV